MFQPMTRVFNRVPVRQIIETGYEINKSLLIKYFLEARVLQLSVN